MISASRSLAVTGAEHDSDETTSLSLLDRRGSEVHQTLEYDLRRRTSQRGPQSRDTWGANARQ